MDWRVGDVVKLKSGGPKMTVHEIEDGYVNCQWFENNKLERGAFRPEVLQKPASPVVGL